MNRVSSTSAVRSPRVSVVVPSWTGEASRLLASLQKQTFRDYEVEVVRGVSPAAKARNVGVARTSGEILLFIDDDAYLGHDRVLERLVAVLDGDPTMAVVGTSKLAPPDAGSFQQAVARQVPRMVYPVVQEDEVTNPPLDRYGYSALTTTCCAVRRDAFDAVGGFDENLATGGEDTDFFYRLRSMGGHLVVAGETWVYHDPPGDLKDLLRKSFWYGLGHALEARKHPSRGMDLLRLDTVRGKLMLPLAIPAFPVALFVHPYFDPKLHVKLGFRPLKTLSTYAVLCGYTYGWFHGHRPGPVQSYRGKPPSMDDPPGTDSNAATS